MTPDKKQTPAAKGETGEALDWLIRYANDPEVTKRANMMRAKVAALEAENRAQAIALRQVEESELFRRVEKAEARIRELRAIHRKYHPQCGCILASDSPAPAAAPSKVTPSLSPPAPAAAKPKKRASFSLPAMVGIPAEPEDDEGEGKGDGTDRDEPGTDR